MANWGEDKNVCGHHWLSDEACYERFEEKNSILLKATLKLQKQNEKHSIDKRSINRIEHIIPNIICERREIENYVYYSVVCVFENDIHLDRFC